MIHQVNGLWWPTADTEARRVIVHDCPGSIDALLKYIPGRDCIVQAGGNVGVYPLALTDHFRKVITFEPDPVNGECLKLNLQARDSFHRVTALTAAVGAELGVCEPVAVDANNCGAHRVDYAKGSVPVWTIDQVPLSAVDAIWLDIEGSELLALKGAEKTIQEFSPVIACEDKGLCSAYGIAQGELQSWLGSRGYEQIDRIGNDAVFRRSA